MQNKTNKSLQLNSLQLKNFKGISQLKIQPNGHDLIISGRNETGKTTIMDAWIWLLFHKDSQGQSTQKFDIKTLSEEGEAKHGLEHMVRGELQISGNSLTLKKTYQEIWRKKRGSRKKEFEGHTTDYFINQVKVKKSEYETKVAEIADSNKFRLMTDPLYFNEQLHWEERRKVLMGICEGVTKEKIVQENPKFQELADIEDVETHIKGLKQKIKSLNDEIDKIPVRIDEVNNSLTGISDLDPDKLKDKLQALKEKKKSKEQELVRIEEGGEVGEKKKEKAELEAKLQEICNEFTQGIEEQINEKKAELEKIDARKDGLTQDSNSKIQVKENTEEKMQRKEEYLKELRSNFHEVKEQVIQFEDKCPTCGQELPEDYIEETKKNFNKGKAAKLEKINEQGRKERLEYDKLEENAEVLVEGINRLESDIKAQEKEQLAVKEQIQKLTDKKSNYKNLDKFKEKESEKERVGEAIQDLLSGRKLQKGEVESQLREIEESLETCQEKLQVIKTYKKGKARIEELKDEEKQLGSKYEELEKELFLCEEFKETRAQLLEEQINDKFELADFRLFETQINQAIKPVCKTTYRGVPFNSLNHGSRIQVGVDIINTLSKEYDFQAPIFVDNQESISEPIETNSQLISLFVTQDKELKIKEVDHDE